VSLRVAHSFLWKLFCEATPAFHNDDPAYLQPFLRTLRSIDGRRMGREFGGALTVNNVKNSSKVKKTDTQRGDQILDHTIKSRAGALTVNNVKNSSKVKNTDTQRGDRTLDHTIKSRALYRLS
jgi:hypothetical protein